VAVNLGMVELVYMLSCWSDWQSWELPGPTHWTASKGCGNKAHGACVLEHSQGYSVHLVRMFCARALLKPLLGFVASSPFVSYAMVTPGQGLYESGASARVTASYCIRLTPVQL
jgi:hypothetical protein